jgi:steroid delta-isomerase
MAPIPPADSAGRPMSVTPLPTPHSSVAQQALPRVVAFFEGLKQHDLTCLDQVYAPDARFKDPFNEVEGLPAVEAIFAHMFHTLEAPHFLVRDRVAQGQQAFLSWDFRFRFKGESAWQTVRGATHLRFDARGLVSEHRDYWDAAEELYEKLPLLGALMRWLKRLVMKGA